MVDLREDIRCAMDFTGGVQIADVGERRKVLDVFFRIFWLREKKRNTWYAVPVKKIRKADSARGPRTKS